MMLHPSLSAPSMHSASGGGTHRCHRRPAAIKVSRPEAVLVVSLLVAVGWPVTAGTGYGAAGGGWAGSPRG
jgi:hypothetical protein